MVFAVNTKRARHLNHVAYAKGIDAAPFFVPAAGLDHQHEGGSPVRATSARTSLSTPPPINAGQMSFANTQLFSLSV